MINYIITITREESMQTKTATIIGGGIAGPIAAIALRRAGIDATVYEAYPGTADGVGAMLSLAPNGIDALRAIGLDAATLGEPIETMIIADDNARPLAAFPTLDGLPPSRVVWRADLYRAIRAHAIANDVKFVHGKQLVDIEETPELIVAQFADGDWATADMLVGADGIRSTVRTLIDPNAPEPRYVGHIGFGGLAVASRFRGAPRTMYFANGKRAFMGYWTQDDGNTVWFANVPRADMMTSAEAREIPTDEWLRRLRALFADDMPGRDLLAHTTAETLVVAGGGETMPSVPKWYERRAVLVGDAAHAPSSSSGQGASMAAESAVELARCLRDLPSHSEAFAAYEALRRPRVEKVAAFGARNNQEKVAGPVAKAIMRVMLPIATKTFLTPEKMFRWMHGHHIEWEATVEDPSLAA
jgi:2-polyprenyl-6-methoxyphenol hydroxylase-like FAD-dependent oxidoreductase